MNNSLFPIVILAGGLATRLRPMTEKIPKSLIPINGEPFINHQLRLLFRQGIRHVVLCVGYLGELIEQHVGNGQQFGLHTEYSYDGSTLLGTAGAIKHALPLLNDNFFVVYGDSFLPCNYFMIQTAYQTCARQGLMTIFHNAGQWDTSNIGYKNGQIIAYDKKSPTRDMQYIDYGLGVFSTQAFAAIPDHHSYDLALLYQTLLKTGQLAAYEVNKRFYEIGSLAGIEQLQYYLSHETSLSNSIL